jgi:iron(III) transport system substrate-binding protein
VPEGAPTLKGAKLIDYDLQKYGASAERKRLLNRWEKEVYNRSN